MSNLIENKNTHTQVVLKKRGRKSKKEIEDIKKLNNGIATASLSTEINTCVTIGYDTIDATEDDDDNLETQEEDPSNIINSKPMPKKRGRKPKGGKIIQNIVSKNNTPESKPNIILHLNCYLKDLNSFNAVNSKIDGFSFGKSNKDSYDVITNNTTTDFLLNEYQKNISVLNAPSSQPYDDGNNDEPHKNNNNQADNKEIWKKLKLLEHNLHTNNVDNKKSSCFWDSCEFDNSPIYIPKYIINGTYNVYGCFCSPECAVAYLMNENIDSSIKFERYQLINNIYSKIYNYNKNIKPAPNPHYMLDKYYGILNIQEYRSLLRKERLFLVVDKPLTRIMPELHEDNDDFIINNTIIPTNNIKVKNILKKQTKTNILSEHFGLA